LFLLPTLLAIIFVQFYPMFYGLILSFTNQTLLRVQTVQFTLSNYQKMFKEPQFQYSLWLQFSFIFIALPLELVIGFFVALLLDKPFRVFKVVRALLMLPVFVLPVLSGLTWRLMLQPKYGVLARAFETLALGPSAWLADTRYAYIAILLQDIWRMWPFMFLLICAGLTSLPQELRESARLDGASFFSETVYIIIPCLKPVLSMAILLRMIDALRIFSEVYVMTYGGPSNATMLLSLYIHKQGFEFGNISYASAMGTVLLFLALPLAYVAVKKSLKV